VIAGPLFVLAFLVEGATRADYDPVRHPVSSLALGHHGWAQTLTFIITGVLVIAYAIGARQALKPAKGSLFGPIGIALWGIGLLGAGVFVTDPVSGYPPGTPAMVQTATTAGTLHDVFSVIAFFTLPVACFAMVRRFVSERRWGWAIYSFVTPIAFLVLFFISGIGFSQEEPFVDVAGAYQRACVTVGFAWLSLLALHLTRRVPATTAAGAPV
jgi:uncharacterized membrane protein YozB (DUF420 family)